MSKRNASKTIKGEINTISALQRQKGELEKKKRILEKKVKAK